MSIHCVKKMVGWSNCWGEVEGYLFRVIRVIRGRNKKHLRIPG